eukprot:g712.t1
MLASLQKQSATALRELARVREDNKRLRLENARLKFDKKWRLAVSRNSAIQALCASADEAIVRRIFFCWRRHVHELGARVEIFTARRSVRFMERMVEEGLALGAGREPEEAVVDRKDKNAAGAARGSTHFFRRTWMHWKDWYFEMRRDRFLEREGKWEMAKLALQDEVGKWRGLCQRLEAELELQIGGPQLREIRSTIASSSSGVAETSVVAEAHGQERVHQPHFPEDIDTALAHERRASYERASRLQSRLNAQQVLVQDLKKKLPTETSEQDNHLSRACVRRFCERYDAFGACVTLLRELLLLHYERQVPSYAPPRAGAARRLSPAAATPRSRGVEVFTTEADGKPRWESPALRPMRRQSKGCDERLRWILDRLAGGGTGSGSGTKHNFCRQLAARVATGSTEQVRLARVLGLIFDGDAEEQKEKFSLDQAVARLSVTSETSGGEMCKHALFFGRWVDENGKADQVREQRHAAVDQLVQETPTSSNTRGGGASTHPAPGAAFLRSGDSCAQTVRKFVLPGVRKAIAELADTNSSVRRLQQGNFGLRFVIEVEVAAINGVCALDVVCEAILGGLENFEVPGLALEHEAGRGRVVLDDARTGSGGASSSTSSRTVIKFGARRLRELVPVAETLGVFAKKTLEEADGEINQNEKVGVLFHPTAEEAACCALFVVFQTADSVLRGMQGPIYTHYACEGDAVVRLSPETILQVPKMVAVRSSGC